MDNRGFFLAEETMKIILAVICLGFLIFILGKMYYSYSIGKDVQQAKDTLNYIEKEINSMKEGAPAREIMIYNPGSSVFGADYWILIGFSGQEKPSSCNGKNCLCLCKNSYGEQFYSRRISKCNEHNICAIFSNTFSFPEIDLKPLPLALKISKVSGKISFS